MSILQQLIEPMPIDDFCRQHLYRRPFAAPFKAERFRNLISWPLLAEIFLTGHGDCWLPHRGRLPAEPELATGRLKLEQALKGFQTGRTVLVRHSERAHPTLGAIAKDFEALFQHPVDIQPYCTPAGEEGFDWHYDVEDVFVIQTGGEKEFQLRQNRANRPPVKKETLTYEEFAQSCVGPEIRCLLKAGDWLYIPAGYWHKAVAVADSYHLSVGVMASPSRHGHTS